MAEFEKTLTKVLSGISDANVPFSALCNLLIRPGFSERIRGDHHIFSHADIREILNLQPLGARAKPYQVKQVRIIILQYKLGGTTIDRESNGSI